MTSSHPPAWAAHAALDLEAIARATNDPTGWAATAAAATIKELAAATQHLPQTLAQLAEVLGECVNAGRVGLDETTRSDTASGAVAATISNLSEAAQIADMLTRSIDTAAQWSANLTDTTAPGGGA